jgi:hypothetical protein
MKIKILWSGVEHIVLKWLRIGSNVSGVLRAEMFPFPYTYLGK